MQNIQTVRTPWQGGCIPDLEIQKNTLHYWWKKCIQPINTTKGYWLHLGSYMKREKGQKALKKGSRILSIPFPFLGTYGALMSWSRKLDSKILKKKLLMKKGKKNFVQIQSCITFSWFEDNAGDGFPGDQSRAYGFLTKFLRNLGYALAELKLCTWITTRSVLRAFNLKSYKNRLNTIKRCKKRNMLWEIPSHYAPLWWEKCDCDFKKKKKRWQTWFSLFWWLMLCTHLKAQAESLINFYRNPKWREEPKPSTMNSLRKSHQNRAKKKSETGFLQSEQNKLQEKEWSNTLSLWSPPIILMLRICSSSSRSSNLSVLVVAGSPDLTSTSLRLPISRFPCTTHLLMNGLYFWGWSNLLTKDQTWSNYEKENPIKVATVQETKLESNLIYALICTKMSLKH